MNLEIKSNPHITFLQGKTCDFDRSNMNRPTGGIDQTNDIFSDSNHD